MISITGTLVVLAQQLPAVPDVQRQLDSAHIVFLERLNSQLVTNPWVAIVASLSVLFTAGAIVAAVLLYRQSKDFRDQRDKTLAEATAVAAVAVAELRATAHAFFGELAERDEERYAELTRQIEERTARVEESSGETKRALTEELARLRRERVAVERQRKSAAAVDSTRSEDGILPGVLRSSNLAALAAALQLKHAVLPLNLQRRFQDCGKCGKRFSLPSPFEEGARGLSGAREVECPYCETLQPIQPIVS